MPASAPAARPQPGRRRRADRRASVRFLPPQEIVCYCGRPSAVAKRARVCDVSAGGACLLVEQRFEVGDVVSVEMINSPHTYLLARELRVVRVFHGHGEDGVIAGEFDRPLAYEELLPFIH